jgi:diguanylate cyclase (GGDEF)-like protein/PAS domain S-box-containing protein
MSGKPRARLARALNAGVVTLCASFIVLGLAVQIISEFRGRADEARRAQLLLEKTQGQIIKLEALEWKALALGELGPALDKRISTTRSEIWATLERLDIAGNDVHRELGDVFWEYVLDEDEELRDLVIGETTPRKAAREERKDPSFTHLQQAILDELASNEATVADANRFATSGVAVTVLLSALAIVLLYRSFRSSRHDKDIADSRRRAVEDSERRFKSLVQNSADVIGIINEMGILTYISSTVKRVMGYEPGELIGNSGFTYIHPEDIESGQDTLMKLVMESGATAEIELRMLHQDGSWRWTEVTGRNLLADPMINGVLINYRDITDRKELESQLRDLAFKDSLTSLANRTLFIDRVDHALTRRERTSAPISVLFLDVDDFKTVNDSLGHATGDKLLSEVGRRLQDCLRPEDTIARLGGDEFAILLEDADAMDARKVAQRILDHIKRPMCLGERESVITISIGIADAAYSHDSEQLLRNADVAMYMAKGRGKARYDLFEPSMHEAAVKRMELKADLQHALDRGEFYLDYQPTVNLTTGEVTGVEALARWNHSKHGLVPPNDFIPLAEESGVILPLGRWVVHEACSQLTKWKEDHPQHRSLTVNVNLSARQLANDSLKEELADVLAKTHTAPENLTLEITESLMMEDAENTIETFRKLKSLGVKVAIDDFGTGYSALSYLRRFPVDVLKIDKEFVDEVTGGEEQSALVHAIIKLANSVGLETVAEGIETPEQVASLRELGCHVGQGFYLARPGSPEKVDEILRDPLALKTKVESAAIDAPVAV